MANEELKKKIVEILDNNIRWQPYYYISRGIVYEDDLKNIADALIEAGLKFDRNISYTATLNLAQLERINDLEKRLAKAAHRAEVAERALLRACKVNTIFAEPDVPNILAESVLYEAYIRQAENELAEERKGVGND